MKRMMGLLAVPVLLLSACSAAPVPVKGTPSARVLLQVSALPPAPSLPRWAPAGDRVLLAIHGGDDNPHGLAAVLGLSEGAAPQPLGPLPTFTPPEWSPDGQSVALVGPRQDVGAVVPTIYRQPVDGGEAVDLLPGAQAVQGVSGTKFISRWAAPDTLYYSEHMGTGVSELRRLDVPGRKVVPWPDGELLQATFYHWADDSSRVAGQIYGGPASFWVWDLQADRFVKPAEQLPGQFQWFEGWQGSDTVLFTAWEGYPYSPEATRATLYRLDLKSGGVAMVAENAVLAQASGDVVAYIALKPSPALVVVDKAGKELRREGLGAL
ncbi:MAG TPA: hypothetical protein VK464_01370, partial [Symbiobacteriaceae bacterium]|nr:hypothetical protein [Symbiobacteriaceae bacterium]